MTVAGLFLFAGVVLLSTGLLQVLSAQLFKPDRSDTSLTGEMRSADARWGPRLCIIGSALLLLGLLSLLMESL